MPSRGAAPPRDRPGRAGFRLWLGAAALLVFAGVAAPYGLLGGGAPGLAVAGFWLAFGFAVVILIMLGVLGWRD